MRGVFQFPTLSRLSPDSLQRRQTPPFRLARPTRASQIPPSTYSVRRKGVFAHGLLKKDSDPVEGRLLSGGQWEYGINVILGQSEQAPDLVIGRSELIAESTGKIELLCS